MALKFSLKQCMEFVNGEMNNHLRQAKRFQENRNNGLPYDPTYCERRAEIFACVHEYLKFGSAGKPFNSHYGVDDDSY